MTEKNRAVIALKFYDGTTFSQWEQATIRERFDDPLGSYQFTVKPVPERVDFFREMLRKGELVAVQVNGHPYATPLIESVTTQADRSGGVTISVECKSVLVTATEASADPTIYKKQQADVPVENLVLEVMGPFGFDTLVSDEAGHAMVLTGKPIGNRSPAITAEELKTKDAQVQDNETCYGYCSRLFSRLGVALRVDYRGYLMLAAPDYEQNASYSLVDWEGEGQRALSWTLRETNRGQFSKVVVLGKDGEGKRKKTQTAKPRGALVQERLTASRFGEIEDSAQATYAEYSSEEPFAKVPTETFSADQPLYTSSVHPFKPKYFVDKRSRDNERCASFCKLIHTKNAPSAFELSVVVDGLVSSSGAVWAINTVCHVRSAALGMDVDMWVHEVQLEQSRGGCRTTLKLIPKGSLILGDIPG